MRAGRALSSGMPPGGGLGGGSGRLGPPPSSWPDSESGGPCEEKKRLRSAGRNNADANRASMYNSANGSAAPIWDPFDIPVSVALATSRASVVFRLPLLRRADARHGARSEPTGMVKSSINRRYGLNGATARRGAPIQTIGYVLDATRQENRELREQVAHLRAENARLRAEFDRRPAQHTPQPWPRGMHEMTAGTCIGPRRRQSRGPRVITRDLRP